MLRQQSFHILRLSLALAVATLSTAGSAQAEREAIRIEYRAERGCSSPDQFAQRVLRLTRTARLAAEDERSRTFAVAIERRADGRQGERNFSGSLVVKENGRSTVARTVTGKTCAEVAEVLALATALAVDPSRTDPDAARPSPIEDSPKAGGDRPQSSSASPKVDRGPSRKSTPRSAREDSTKSEDGDERETTTLPFDVPTSPLSQSLALFAGPGVKLGASPNIAAGAIVAVELQPLHLAALLHSIGAEFTLLRSFSERVESASVTFDLAFVRPRLCVRLAQLSRTLRLASCLGAELGFLIARGEDLPHPRTERRAWAAAEATLRLQLDLTEQWLVGFDAAGSVPFTRDKFFFEDPETPIYDVPGVGFAAGVKLGVRL